MPEILLTCRAGIPSHWQAPRPLNPQLRSAMATALAWIDRSCRLLVDLSNRPLKLKGEPEAASWKLGVHAVERRGIADGYSVQRAVKRLSGFFKAVKKRQHRNPRLADSTRQEAKAVSELAVRQPWRRTQAGLFPFRRGRTVTGPRHLQSPTGQRPSSPSPTTVGRSLSTPRALYRESVSLVAC